MSSAPAWMEDWRRTSEAPMLPHYPALQIQALLALIDQMGEALRRSRDTLEDTRAAMMLLQRLIVAQAMDIALSDANTALAAYERGPQ